jgi:hypothetical protein
MGEPKHVTTVKIEPSIHKLVKVAAAEKGLTIGQVYEMGVLRVLRDMGKKA